VVPPFLLFFLFYLPFPLCMTRWVHIKIEVQVNLLLELRCIFEPLFFRVGHANEVWRPQFRGFRWRCSKKAKGGEEFLPSSPQVFGPRSEDWN
jgi:hypothetical protein